jgi:hypothetical protein
MMSLQRSSGHAEAVAGENIFIGVSSLGILSSVMVQSMTTQVIVFAPVYAITITELDSGMARFCVDPEFVAQYCHDFIYEGLLKAVPSLEETRM